MNNDGVCRHCSLMWLISPVRISHKVETYSELARNGLRRYSGPMNAEVAK